MATVVAEISRFRIAIVANDHIQQYDAGFFAFHPIRHTLKRLAAMVAGQHDAGNRAIGMPFPTLRRIFPSRPTYWANFGESEPMFQTVFWSKL